MHHLPQRSLMENSDDERDIKPDELTTSHELSNESQLWDKDNAQIVLVLVGLIASGKVCRKVDSCVRLVATYTSQIVYIRSGIGGQSASISTVQSG